MDGSDESSCEDTYTDCRKTPEISGCEFKSSESASASTSENDNYSSINGLPVLEFKSIEGNLIYSLTEQYVFKTKGKRRKYSVKQFVNTSVCVCFYVCIYV